MSFPFIYDSFSFIFPCRSRRNRANPNSSGSGRSDWRSKCRELIDIIWNHPDSAPFREPVDTIEHAGNFCHIFFDRCNFDTKEPHMNRFTNVIPLFSIAPNIIDYLQTVDTPMDLRTIKEELRGDNYESATAFLEDMRLIFTNSRAFNTNTRSRVSRLCHIAMFMIVLRGLESNSIWKSAKNTLIIIIDEQISGHLLYFFENLTTKAFFTFLLAKKSLKTH